MAFARFENQPSQENTITDLEKEVRFLSPSHRDKLCNVLSIDQGQHLWKTFMSNITKSRDDPNPKYNLSDISIIENASTDPKKRVDILLDEWGTSGRKRPRLLDLIHVLRRDDVLTRALHVVVTEILGFDHIEDLPPDASLNDTSIIEMNGFSLDWPQDVTYKTVNESRPEEINATLTQQSGGFDESFSDFNGPMSIGDVPRLNYFFLQTITSNFSEVSFSDGGAKLGQGSFGSVFYGQMSGQLDIHGPVAVKRLNEFSDRLEVRFNAEIECMRYALHENILQLLAYSNDGSHLCLVYEYMENGNLADALKLKSRTSPLTSTQRFKIAMGTARGLSYLHNHSREKSLVHRDVKPENILLDTELRPKLSDFGLVRLTGEGDFNTSVDQTSVCMGTPIYMAPEVRLGEVSYKSDVYSFGVVMLELLTSIPAVGNETTKMHLVGYWEDLEPDDRSSIVDPVFTTPGCSFSHRDWGDVADQCLEYKRRKRPDMETVIEKLNNLSSISLC